LEEDGAALLLDNDSLDEGDCLSVPSIVRKEAESGAPVQEENSIGSSITPINWRSGFQNGVVAGTDHDDYYGNTPAAEEAVDAVPDFVDADIYGFHPGLDNDDPMDAAFLFENDGLDEGDCFSVSSLVRKEAESSAPQSKKKGVLAAVSRLQTGVQGFKMVLVLVRIMTIITGIPQRQEKPLMLFQTLLTLIFMGSTPA